MNKPEKIERTAHHWLDIANWLEFAYNISLFQFHGRYNFANVCFVTPCSCDGDRCEACDRTLELCEIWIDPDCYSETWQREIATIIKGEFFPNTKDRTAKIWVGGRDE